MKYIVDNVAQSPFDLWQATGDADIDSRMLKLFRSDFFQQFEMFSEQFFVILDQRNMTYLYISDNVEAVSGYTLKELYDKGMSALAERYHADDLEKMNVFFPALIQSLKALSREEILSCRISYDYRLQFADGHYHWLLQHSIPLTLDGDSNIVHALIIVTDITNYKRHTCCCYRVSLYDDRLKPTVLLEGTTGDARMEGITRRERDILELTASGLSEKEIGDRLHISIQTVKTHRRNLFRKTGAKNSPELIRFAIANLMIE